jgi:hypothetical protein
MDMTPAFAGAPAEPPGLDAHDLVQKKKGFKRGSENFFLGRNLGSGLIDHSQNMTAAAMQIAEK